MLEIIIMILSAIFVLFIPGLACTFALFPKKNEIDWLERIALSFALSIAITPLLVFYTNFLLSAPINILTATTIIVGIIITSIAIWYVRVNKVVFLKIKKVK